MKELDVLLLRPDKSQLKDKKEIQGEHFNQLKANREGNIVDVQTIYPSDNGIGDEVGNAVRQVLQTGNSNSNESLNAAEDVVQINLPEYDLDSLPMIFEHMRKLGVRRIVVTNIQELSSINHLMLQEEFHLLMSLKDCASDGEVRTCLYSTSIPDRFIYDNADLILQIITACDRKCDGCYAKTKDQKLDLETIREAINQIPQDGMVSLRGGEPTLFQDWYEAIVSYALENGLNVAIDTNGSFLDNPNNDEIINKLANPKILLRVSFDYAHLSGISDKDKKMEFDKMTHLAAKAITKGINLRFTCLGMDDMQIDKMINGTSLKPYRKLFVPLAFYSDIEEVHIKGAYVDVNGISHDTLKA